MGCRRIDGIVAGLLLGVSTPAQAAPAVKFDIGAGNLGQALIELGRQAQITVGVTDPNAARARSRGVHGRMDLRRALTRLLAGTGYTFVLTAGSVRIVREAPKRAPQPRSAGAESEPTPPPQGDIVVTASKQGVRLSRFGGTIQLIDLNASELGRRGSEGTEAVLDLLPAVASTHLGPGRDKIYVRGVADSSFNGPSQSVVGLYLGDVRLTYNAPDPDLALYDMDRVELLEGPQGALYGTGRSAVF